MKLISIDLDGTLLSSDQSTSQKNIRTMEHLSEDYSPFICSGREVEGTNNILKKPGLRVSVVGLNGPVGFDGEKKIFESSFDKNDVKKIDSVLSKSPTRIYTDLGSYESQNYKDKMKGIFHEVGGEFSIKEPNYEPKYEKPIYSIPYNNIEEIIEKSTISIYKFFIFTPNCQLRVSIFNHLREMLDMSVTKSASINIEIVPRNASKGVVFNRLESVYDLRKPLGIAIGDSSSDLSMLESADISFAMGNGHQEIMKKADCVIASDDKDGVSQAFERILTI